MDNPEKPDVSQSVEGAPSYAVVAAESLQELRTLTLKNGDTFAVFNRAGDIRSSASSPEGIFHRDTRHLSSFLLTIAGARPMLLSATLRDDNAILTCDLANPDMPGPQTVEHDRIHIRRSRFLWNGSCMERIAARNFDRRPRRIELEIAFAADFADVFEVRGSHRERRGTMRTPKVETDSVMLSYDGLDGERRETNVRFDPAPDQSRSNERPTRLSLRQANGGQFLLR